jgi:hypothetical protein
VTLKLSFLGSALTVIKRMYMICRVIYAIGLRYGLGRFFIVQPLYQTIHILQYLLTYDTQFKKLKIYAYTNGATYPPYCLSVMQQGHTL